MVDAWCAKSAKRESVMNLCSDGHDEICYEGRECPVCILIVKMCDLDSEIGDLKKQVEELEEEVERLGE